MHPFRIKGLAARTTAGFLVGGLASSRGTTCTIANGLPLFACICG